jgi:hypothetical protein
MFDLHASQLGPHFRIPTRRNGQIILGRITRLPPRFADSRTLTHESPSTQYDTFNQVTVDKPEALSLSGLLDLLVIGSTQELISKDSIRAARAVCDLISQRITFRGSQTRFQSPRLTSHQQQVD